MKSELPHRAVNMWLLTAAIPAILSVTGRSGYLGILAGALVCGGVCMAVRVYGSGKVPRWICAAELLWLIVFLGAVAKESGACWEGQPIAVPGILLALFVLSQYPYSFYGIELPKVSCWRWLHCCPAAVAQAHPVQERHCYGWCFRFWESWRWQG